MRKWEVKAIGVIEIVLVLVVLVGLVLIFKEQITSLVNNVFSELSGDVNKIMK